MEGPHLVLNLEEVMDNLEEPDEDDDHGNTTDLELCRRFIICHTQAGLGAC